MKLQFALFLSLVSGSAAFAPQMISGRRAMSLSIVDTSSAIDEAMAASEEFGKTSPEARSAWDVVEELDAANSRQRQLEKQIKAKQEELECLVDAAADAQPAATLHSDTSELVKKALEMSRTYGKTSKEARMAWEVVEEVDAANSHHRRGDIHVSGVATPEEECSEAPTLEKDEPSKLTVKINPETVEEAIATAMLLKQTYGGSSKESRLAWELVEEMEAADSHKRAQQKAALEKMVKQEQSKAAAEAAAATPVNTMVVDSETAVKAALEISKKFGATSKEAMVAWEEVEELRATAAHHKTTGSG
jgi:hypothetical protein